VLLTSHIPFLVQAEDDPRSLLHLLGVVADETQHGFHYFPCEKPDTAQIEFPAVEKRGVLLLKVASTPVLVARKIELTCELSRMEPKEVRVDLECHDFLPVAKIKLPTRYLLVKPEECYNSH